MVTISKRLAGSLVCDTMFIRHFTNHLLSFSWYGGRISSLVKRSIRPESRHIVQSASTSSDSPWSQSGLILTIDTTSLRPWNLRSLTPVAGVAASPPAFSFPLLSWRALLKHAETITSALAVRHSRRGSPSFERMMSSRRRKYVGLFIRTRKYLIAAGA